MTAIFHISVFVALFSQWVLGSELKSSNAVYCYDRKQYRLGHGSFGEAIAGTKIVGNHLEPVAMKFEKITPNTVYVGLEKQFYKILSGHPGIPKFHDYLRDNQGNAVLIIELLGHDLTFYRKAAGGRFSPKTTMMIGLQLLKILEYIHSKGIVFNDLKPDNVAVGYDDDSRIYILDLGLCTYWRKNGMHVDPESVEAISGRGTPDYMSIYAHKHVVLSRRDDIESMAYMLVELLQGKLPWSKDNNNVKNIFYRKTSMSPDDIVGDKCAATLKKFLMYARRLRFSERPNYQYLRDLLTRDLALHGDYEDMHFDWIANGLNIEKPKSNILSVANAKGIPIGNSAPIQMMVSNDLTTAALMAVNKIIPLPIVTPQMVQTQPLLVAHYISPHPAYYQDVGVTSILTMPQTQVIHTI